MGRRAKDRLHLDKTDQKKAGLASKPAFAPTGETYQKKYEIAGPDLLQPKRPGRSLAIVPVGVRAELGVEVSGHIEQSIGDPLGERFVRIVVTSQVPVSHRTARVDNAGTPVRQAVGMDTNQKH